MKKLTLMLALMSMVYWAGAQSINLSNAYEAQNRGYLVKAKGYIDQASEHADTKAEAKTWFYKTLIYCKIGGAIVNPQTKAERKEGQNLAKVCPHWYSTAFEALFAWQQFDKEGEYTDKIKRFFPYLGNTYYNMAVTEYEKSNFDMAMNYCDSAIMLANVFRNDDLANNAYYLAGCAAQSTRNTDLTKKYFQPLVTAKVSPKSVKFDVKMVYEALFTTYYKEGDTVKAMRTARAFTQACKTDYNAHVLMATAFIYSGNNEQALKSINMALTLAEKDSAQLPVALCRAASIYDLSKQFDKAEECYRKSLALNSNQYEANYGQGIMLYNRAVDKVNAASEVPVEDETGLYDKLNEEAKQLFSASVPYFKGAISYIDGLTNEDDIAVNRPNLGRCLTALRTVYARVNQSEELKEVNARLEALQK
ncbi:MAG: hypothetical protein IJV22_09880 [Bacteroidales bacterium]|nr:hypothetical protein [Bacteroidales bacterium]